MKLRIQSLPIGEQNLQFEKIDLKNNRIIMTARVGFMEAVLTVHGNDIPTLTKLMINRVTLKFFLQWLYHKLRRKKIN
jgi:hypothetical protein